jgi:hypothetical protein
MSQIRVLSDDELFAARLQRNEFTSRSPSPCKRLRDSCQDNEGDVEVSPKKLSSQGRVSRFIKGTMSVEGSSQEISTSKKDSNCVEENMDVDAPLSDDDSLSPVSNEALQECEERMNDMKWL